MADRFLAFFVFELLADSPGLFKLALRTASFTDTKVPVLCHSEPIGEPGHRSADHGIRIPNEARGRRFGNVRSRQPRVCFFKHVPLYFGQLMRDGEER